MKYTLGEAARATGKSKTSIHRAIKSGRISADKNSLGAYAIDPVELHREFPRIEESNEEEPLRNTLHGTNRNVDLEQQFNELEDRIKAEAERDKYKELLVETKKRLEELREEREGWKQAFERSQLLLTSEKSEEDKEEIEKIKKEASAEKDKWEQLVNEQQRQAKKLEAVARALDNEGTLQRIVRKIAGKKIRISSDGKAA